tara:strand:- start:220 stop:363 length:144 start_codon:yes stop_codon:yes gene_type:complete
VYYILKDGKRLPDSYATFEEVAKAMRILQEKTKCLTEEQRYAIIVEE